MAISSGLDTVRHGPDHVLGSGPIGKGSDFSVAGMSTDCKPLNISPGWSALSILECIVRWDSFFLI